MYNNIMKTVIWIDGDGYKHRSLLRDSDPDHLVMQGIPQEPPDLKRLDWDSLMRDLHNILVERGIITWDDVQRGQNMVSSAILQIFKRPIVGLYREDSRNGKMED
jgi:hypothetical protein